MPAIAIPQTQRRTHALIVEEAPELRELLSEITGHFGFDVHAVSDGLQALHSLDRLSPDIVVVDLHTPKLDGQQLISRLRQLPELDQIPVLMILPGDSRHARITLLECGVDDFIVKPIEPEEYRVRLRALLRRSGLEVSGDENAAAPKTLDPGLVERNQELERLNLELLAALERANTLEEADTGQHIQRVSAYAAVLARAHGCDPAFVDQLVRYAGLHDVGKVGVRDEILKKPGKLTHDEFDEMKSHTIIGARLLRAAGLPATASNIALCHHERWDGTGYPYGLSGRKIPLEARIVSVVDVFDALRSKRCYKPAFSFEKSKRIMLESAGTHLDPGLVPLLFRNERELVRIALRYADDSIGAASTPQE